MWPTSSSSPQPYHITHPLYPIQVGYRVRPHRSTPNHESLIPESQDIYLSSSVSSQFDPPVSRSLQPLPTRFAAQTSRSRPNIFTTHLSLFQRQTFSPLFRSHLPLSFTWNARQQAGPPPVVTLDCLRDNFKKYSPPTFSHEPPQRHL